MSIRLVKLEDTEHLKDYPGYGVDTNGNVWSFKYKKPRVLSPGWKKKNSDDKAVLLTDRFGRKKSFLVHRLVALAFLPTNDITMRVNHKNKNSSDNRLENLEWKNEQKRNTFNGYIVDKRIADLIQSVHTASIKKGLKVPDLNTFFNLIIDTKLNDYIKQYGLQKVM